MCEGYPGGTAVFDTGGTDVRRTQRRRLASLLPASPLAHAREDETPLPPRRPPAALPQANGAVPWDCAYLAQIRTLVGSYGMLSATTWSDPAKCLGPAGSCPILTAAEDDLKSLTKNCLEPSWTLTNLGGPSGDCGNT